MTMITNTITQIAKVTHEANKAWCEANGDFTQRPWVVAPKWQQESALDGVRFVINNPDAPSSANHDNWLKLKESEGWVYGEEKNESLRTHPCMVPYEELPEVQKRKDALFRAVVKALI